MSVNNKTGHPLLLPALAGVAMASALVSAALGLTFSFQRLVSTSGFLFFYAAIVFSAWFGGKWAGAAAVVLGMITVEYFFMTPLHSFEVDRDSLPLFLEFAGSS